MSSRKRQNPPRDQMESDYFGDDDDISGRDDYSSASSSPSSGGTLKGFSRKLKETLTQRLHLELFGITWFDFAAMSCARWVFLFALMAAATGLAVSVFLRLRNEEEQNFDEEVSEHKRQRIDPIFVVVVVSLYHCKFVIVHSQKICTTSFCVGWQFDFFS